MIARENRCSSGGEGAEEPWPHLLGAITTSKDNVPLTGVYGGGAAGATWVSEVGQGGGGCIVRHRCPGSLISMPRLQSLK